MNAYDSVVAMLRERLAEDEPGTSILVTRRGEIVLEFYCGLADLATGERLTAGHRMGIASMSKQFTGMAILFLCDAGKVTLDDAIIDYFPDLPAAAAGVTIRQALSHTSGFPELTQNSQFMTDIGQPHTVAQILDYGFSGPFRSLPGEKFLYNNTGYTLAVALVERLTGMGFAQFINERILAPLGMIDTYVCDYSHDAIDAVPRYEPTEYGFKPAIAMHFSNLIGGGSMVSTVRDLAKWGNALLTGKGLPFNYVELWRPNQLANGESTAYGLGLGVDELDGVPYTYHPGQGSGMDAINAIFPSYELTINIVRNLSSPRHPAKEISDRIARAFLAEAVV